MITGSKTIKHLEKNLGEHLWDIGVDKDLLNRTPKEWSMTEKNKLNLIKNVLLFERHY